jgi:rare lipoprotein A (peptidoglycan hydrolase)
VIGSAGMRAAALGAVALVAIAVALAVTHNSHRSSGLPPAAGDWYTALAAPYAPSKGSAKSACGVAIGTATIGVAHPVLPCGVKLYVEYKGKQVLTQVIDRGHTIPGREFDLTQALAKLLHVEGTQTIQWRFAR